MAAAGNQVIRVAVDFTDDAKAMLERVTAPVDSSEVEQLKSEHAVMVERFRRLEDLVSSWETSGYGTAAATARAVRAALDGVEVTDGPSTPSDADKAVDRVHSLIAGWARYGSAQTTFKAAGNLVRKALDGAQ